MKILIAPDSFKESLSARQVATTIAKGFAQVFPQASYQLMPLADGGEGTVEVLIDALKGQWHEVASVDPLGRPITAKWVSLPNQTALIEISSASGLILLAPEERNPLITTSYGTGLVIKQALDQGAKHLIIGLGGSATNDAGTGLAKALGINFFDHTGTMIAPTGGNLNQIATIDASIREKYGDIKVTIACDVTNPLTGEFGASAVFGPQKGATQDAVQQLDHNLNHIATLATTITLLDYQQPGFGAAGGACLGLSLCFEIQLVSGIAMVLDLLGAKELVQQADLIITGEGKIDNQTLSGKVPMGIAQLAKQFNKPIIAIAGSVGSASEQLMDHFTSVTGSVNRTMDLAQALEQAATNLEFASINVARNIKLGMMLQNLEKCKLE